MPEARLGDVAVEGGLIGGPFGSNLVSDDYTNVGIPVIRGANLSFGRTIGGDYAFVSIEKYQRDLRRNTALPGDIVYTQRGTLGQVALVPMDEYPLYVISQSQMRLRVDSLKADSRFVFYACATSQFKRQIADRAISTGVPHINLGILGDLRIPLPSIPTQHAIAAALGALDDKIEANRKLVATADDWVRAAFLGSAQHASEVVTLGALVNHVRESVTSVEEQRPYVGLEDVPRRLMWLDQSPVARDVSSPKSMFRARDILFGKLRPYFHKAVSAPSDGICSTEILVLRSIASDLEGFALAACVSDEVVREVSRQTEGTRMPRTNWRQLQAVEVPWPGDSAAKALSSTIETLRDLAEARIRENHSLGQLRDALLPKLMSGELRVRDAEAAVAEAV